MCWNAQQSGTVITFSRKLYLHCSQRHFYFADDSCQAFHQLRRVAVLIQFEPGMECIYSHDGYLHDLIYSVMQVLNMSGAMAAKDSSMRGALIQEDQSRVSFNSHIPTVSTIQ